MSNVEVMNCPKCGNLVSKASKSCPNPFGGMICEFNVKAYLEKLYFKMSIAACIVALLGWGIYEVWSWL